MAPATRTISVAPPPVVAMHVENIVTGLIVKTRSSQATATLLVLDSAGQSVSGSAVSGQWSGLVSKAVRGTTATDGSLKLTSSSTSPRGTFTFTVVAGISRTGYISDSIANSAPGMGKRAGIKCARRRCSNRLDHVARDIRRLPTAGSLD